MKIGFSEQIITPPLDIEMVGYIPSRRAESVEKDLTLKVSTIQDEDKLYVWLTVDMLGLDNYFKEVLLSKLEQKDIIINDLQMFSTHTHSGPTCLSKEQYYSDLDNKHGGLLLSQTDQLDKDFFDFLVSKAEVAIVESINNLDEFTYKVGRGTMKNFQTNRINKDYYSFNDILVIEVIKNNKKSLLYSFSGHPTILNSASTRISPDYIGEVALNLSEIYSFTQFFNSACGDMSTRYTKSDSTLEELKRLGKIASDCVLEATKNLSEKRVMKSIKYENTTFDLNFKKFLPLDVAEKNYFESKKLYDEALSNKEDALTLRALRGTLEGNMVNLYHSSQNYKDDFYTMNIGVIRIDNYTIINLESEVFSSLIEPLVSNNLWINALSGQFSTYLSDKRGFDLKTYEALSSLYEYGEGERLIEYLKEII